jgi:DNA-binding NarL/FixJ family response regulator
LIKVGVVAAAMALRVGLREVLNGLPDVTVVAEAAYPEALPACDADVLVLAGAIDLDSLEKTTALLLLTDDPADAQGLFDLFPSTGLRRERSPVPAVLAQAGERSGQVPAWGVLPLNASEDELAAALRSLGEGLWVGTPALMRDLFSRRQAQALDETGFMGEALTDRETEVLQLVAQGLANKQIALALGISEHTVKFHLSSLYAKLGVASRTEAVHAGVRRGLVVL